MYSRTRKFYQLYQPTNTYKTYTETKIIFGGICIEKNELRRIDAQARALTSFALIYSYRNFSVHAL